MLVVPTLCTAHSYSYELFHDQPKSSKPAVVHLLFELTLRHHRIPHDTVLLLKVCFKWWEMEGEERRGEDKGGWNTLIKVLKTR